MVRSEPTAGAAIPDARASRPPARGRPPFGRGAPDAVWPAAPGPIAEPVRHQRDMEPLEKLDERFPAESVLLDLDPDHAAADALVIVARFAALRVALLAADGVLAGGTLAAEQSAAAAYAGTVPRGNVEGPLLREIARQAGRGEMKREMPALLADAAAAATARGHAHGAFALLHAAWSMGKAVGALDVAASAARAIAGLADQRGAPRSYRLWTRRARSLEKRARSLDKPPDVRPASGL